MATLLFSSVPFFSCQFILLAVRLQIVLVQGKRLNICEYLQTIHRKRENNYNFISAQRHFNWMSNVFQLIPFFNYIFFIALICICCCSFRMHTCERIVVLFVLSVLGVPSVKQWSFVCVCVLFGRQYKKVMQIMCLIILWVTADKRIGPKRRFLFVLLELSLKEVCFFLRFRVLL